MTAVIPAKCKARGAGTVASAVPFAVPAFRYAGAKDGERRYQPPKLCGGRIFTANDVEREMMEPTFAPKPTEPFSNGERIAKEMAINLGPQVVACIAAYLFWAWWVPFDPA